MFIFTLSEKICRVIKKGLHYLIFLSNTILYLKHSKLSAQKLFKGSYNVNISIN